MKGVYSSMPIMRKVTTDHLARNAIVYVQQLTTYQVANKSKAGDVNTVWLSERAGSATVGTEWGPKY
jgi:hypothetical protein